VVLCSFQPMHDNNHYAQRAIIKAWSRLNNGGRHDGFVWCLDFVAGRYPFTA